MTPSHPHLDADVIVVGAGPVGLLLASELMLGGASVLTIERETEPSELIRAGSINLASAEILGRRGLLTQAREAQRRELAPAIDHLARQTGESRDEVAARMRDHAPRANHFAGIMLDAGLLDPEDPDVRAHHEATDAMFIAQREVEALLAAHADRLGVPVRRGVTMTGLRDCGDHVEVDTDHGRLRAVWVVGCDGGRSPVRHAAGFGFPGSDPEITGRQANVRLGAGDEKRLGFGWRWTERGVYRHGPRAGTVLTVEFDGPPADRDRPVTAAEIESSLRRVTGEPIAVIALDGEATRWTDNARQADGYRRGHVLLAGDAAHVHSPFSGQGLNLGLGDAMNLGFKLSAVATGVADVGLLDSYTAERHPRGGWVLDWTRAQVALMRPDRKTGQLREVVADLLATTEGLTRVANLISGVTQQVALPGEHPLVGRLVPDLWTAAGRPLRDAFTDGRFVLLDRGPDRHGAAVADDWGARVRIVADDAVPGEPTGLLVRPDGVIAWATDADDDTDGLRAVLDRWAGAPDRANILTA